MKKNIVLSIAILALTAASSNAYVDNQYMKSTDFMLNTGYSTDMARMVNVVAADPYREPYQEPKDASTIWKRIYNYVAPTMYNDLTFYNRDINFHTTDWKDF